MRRVNLQKKLGASFPPAHPGMAMWVQDTAETRGRSDFARAVVDIRATADRDLDQVEGAEFTRFDLYIRAIADKVERCSTALGPMMAGIEIALARHPVQPVVAELFRDDCPRLVQIAGLEQLPPCERVGRLVWPWFHIARFPSAERSTLRRPGDKPGIWISFSG